MLVRDLAYDIEVHYLNGKEMFLADTLSRAYLPKTTTDRDEEFKTINAFTYLVIKKGFTSSASIPTMTQPCNS